MTDQLRAAALLAATITTGIVTGVIFLYASTIMPGLRRTDDRTFIGAFQQIDTAIINPWFMFSFFGALVFTGLALVLHLDAEVRSPLPWIVAALVLYVGVVVITIAVNVPLNDAIKAAGAPDQIADLAAVRERFNAARWVRWNLVRMVASLIGFGCLAWALVLQGRT
jgi:uncharacterized membrane protein